MKFELNILGCGAATPTLKRNPTAQLLNLHDKYFLIDCAEGTQLQLRRYKIKFQRINYIFVSHLHGDHYLGLPGLVSSMHLFGRTRELHIYGPPKLEELLRINLEFSDTYLNFELIFHPVNFKEPELVYDDKTLEIRSFPLKHRIDCAGYVFREKPKNRRIIKEEIKLRNLTVAEIVSLKKCQDVTREDGSVLTYEDCTLPPYPQRSYAYCSDTAYYEKIIPEIEGVDVLYHEATFTEEHKSRAKDTFHSTAKQAASIAKQAGVGKLILGHYSSRYRELDNFLDESHELFENVVLAKDGLKVVL